MPDRPLWTERIPDAMEALKVWQGPLISTRDVQTLLEVSPRRAQEILKTAGATAVGRNQMIPPADFRVYLETVGGPQLAQMEKDRRRQFAKRLTKMRQDWIEAPRLYIEPDEEIRRRAWRYSLDGLPDGVILGAGTIYLQFRTPEEALQKLMAIAVAASKDLEGFFDRVRLQDSLFEQPAKSSTSSEKESAA